MIDITKCITIIAAGSVIGFLSGYCKGRKDERKFIKRIKAAGLWHMLGDGAISEEEYKKKLSEIKMYDI